MDMPVMLDNLLNTFVARDTKCALGEQGAHRLDKSPGNSLYC